MTWTLSTPAFSILAFAAATLAAPTLASDNFQIYIINNCNVTQEFGIYGVTADWQPYQFGNSVSIPADAWDSLAAPYYGQGLRLSGLADQGLDAVWLPQLLFEFSYSTYDDAEGTAYDISLMPGIDPLNSGLAAYPVPNGQGSGSCEAKVCYSQTDCPLTQGWTNPAQVDDGSPADTECYHGKTELPRRLVRHRMSRLS